MVAIFIMLALVPAVDNIHMRIGLEFIYPDNSLALFTVDALLAITLGLIIGESNVITLNNIRTLPDNKLKELIRSSGFFNQKSIYLKEISNVNYTLC